MASDFGEFERSIDGSLAYSGYRELGRHFFRAGDGVHVVLWLRV